MDATVDFLFATLAEKGHRQYDGEAVTQLQHALQAATLAERDAAPPMLVAAALFHDLGHLVHDLGEDAAARGMDDRHEWRALGLLRRVLPAEVWEPVRMHVDAKRYLCATEIGYFAALSAASVRSLALQGGPMNAEEARAFAAHPHAEAAICLRRYDEAAKDPGAETPDLEHFHPLVTALATAR
jgi:[1-hydroxy-2-(trimethylamino)ethyl]phosphonate dioxygenase